MARRRDILIGCPQYRVLVRGTYACDEGGQFLFGADGSFLLENVRCGHHEGRCMQTLCVLHRYNKAGSASWYPEKILTAPAAKPRPKRQGPREADRPAGGRDDGGVDLLC